MPSQKHGISRESFKWFENNEDYFRSSYIDTSDETSSDETCSSRSTSNLFCNEDESMSDGGSSVSLWLSFVNEKMIFDQEVTVVNDEETYTSLQWKNDDAASLMMFSKEEIVKKIEDLKDVHFSKGCEEISEEASFDNSKDQGENAVFY